MTSDRGAIALAERVLAQLPMCVTVSPVFSGGWRPIQ